MWRYVYAIFGGGWETVEAEKRAEDVTKRTRSVDMRASEGGVIEDRELV